MKQTMVHEVNKEASYTSCIVLGQNKKPRSQRLQKLMNASASADCVRGLFERCYNGYFFLRFTVTFLGL